MTSPTNWPHPANDPELYLRHQEKRMLKEQRRPSVRKASDLMGPGFAPLAVQVTDWNADELAFNGYWWSQGGTGVLNSPWEPSDWMGYTVSNGTNGVQQIWEMTDDLLYEFRRSWRLIAGVRVYTDWVQVDLDLPYALLKASAPTSIPNDLTFKIDLDIVHMDTNYFDYFDDHIKVLVAGDYDIHGFAKLSTSGGAVDYQALIINKNSVDNWDFYEEYGGKAISVENFPVFANDDFDLSYFQSQTTGTASRNTSSTIPSYLLIRKSRWP